MHTTCIKSSFIFLSLFAALCASAQRMVLQGSVIDARSKESLPFVNVLIQGTTIGTTTSIDGRFRIEIGPNATLILSYVGYETRTVTPETNTPSLLIELTESTHLLETVEVLAGENPAFKIIRKATSNRAHHDPENLESFSYKGYHKLYATSEGVFGFPADTARMSRFLNNNHLFMNESYTERKFVKPNSDKEVVIGNRMSGVKDPFFAILATNFQPFSFYKNYIPLMGKNYINPISPGSLKRYNFEIADTVFTGSDTTYIISFDPLPGKTFESLKGLLYISSNGYALEHVLAEPADPEVLITMRVQQKYTFIQGHWFPEQLNTEFVLKEYKLGKHPIKYVQRSYLSSIEVNPAISKKEFGLLNLEFTPLANRQKEEFWKNVRLDSLTLKEKNTYAVYDSAKKGPLASLNTAVKMAEAFAVEKFSAGNFYIPIEYIFKANRYEDYRFGVGLQTGEQISRTFILDSYIGYGVKDKAVKFGGGIQFNLYSQKDLFLKFSYAQDITEPGNSNFIKSPVTATGGQLLRNLLSFRMDSVEQFKALLHIRALKFTQLTVFARQQRHNPAYEYSYRNDDASALERFTVSEVGIQWRYAFQENYAQMGNTSIVTNFAYPQLNLAASKGVSSAREGKFDFIKIEAKFDYQFLIRGWGKTNFQLAAGYLEGTAPYSYLFNGKGTKLNSAFFNNAIIPNHFQTMGIYEFTSDRYAYLFLTHNFGSIVGTKSKYFRPELSINQNIGIGNLRANPLHEGVVLQSPDKGFFESGITLSNIVRFKYFNIVYTGFGIGAFYRYGAYAFPSAADNLTLKFAITFSF